MSPRTEIPPTVPHDSSLLAELFKLPLDRPEADVVGGRPRRNEGGDGGRGRLIGDLGHEPVAHRGHDLNAAGTGADVVLSSGLIFGVDFSTRLLKGGVRRE